jgi:hypothetical protein
MERKDLVCTANEGPVRFQYKCLLWNLYFAVENSWLNRRSGEKGRELPPTTAENCPPLLSCGSAEGSHK